MPMRKERHTKERHTKISFLKPNGAVIDCLRYKTLIRLFRNLLDAVMVQANLIIMLSLGSMKTDHVISETVIMRLFRVDI